MSLIQTPWTSQPQVATGLREKYENILFGSVGFGQSLTSKPLLVSGAPERRVASGGVGSNNYQVQALDSTPGKYFYLPSSSVKTHTGALTLVANFYLLPQDETITVASRGVITKSQGAGSATNQRSFALVVDYQTANDGVTAYPSFFVSTDGTSAAVKTVRGTNAIPENGLYTVVAVFRPSQSLDLYCNGALVGQNTTSIPATTYAGTAPCVIGSQYSFGGTSDSLYTLSGQINLTAAFPFAASHSEAITLSQNPWQIFKPLPRRIFVPVSTGGGTTAVTADHSASYTITGSVAADASAAYAIRAAVTADATASYALRAAVASDLAGSYAIQTAGTVTTGIDAAYAVRGSVAGDINVGYQIAAAVQAEVAAAYAVRAAVQKDLSAGYAIQAGLSAVSADLIAAYAVDGSTTTRAPSGAGPSIILPGSTRPGSLQTFGRPPNLGGRRH